VNRIRLLRRRAPLNFAIIVYFRENTHCHPIRVSSNRRRLQLHKPVVTWPSDPATFAVRSGSQLWAERGPFGIIANPQRYTAPLPIMIGRRDAARAEHPMSAANMLARNADTHRAVMHRPDDDRIGDQRCASARQRPLCAKKPMPLRPQDSKHRDPIGRLARVYGRSPLRPRARPQGTSRLSSPADRPRRR
jgi:hypothetical protein